MLWPIAFEREVGSAPVPITLRGQRRVLWRTKQGIACVDDVCPHRRASLSAGRVLEDGTLECGYHGWRFDGGGRCARIPQLDAKKKIPKACDARSHTVLIADGIVWVSDRLGHGALGTPTDVLANASEFDIVTEKSFVMPYSYDFQIENVLDVAHLHFTHDRLFGDRAKGSPIAASNIVETDDMMSAHFVHESDTPDVCITFLKPGAVTVHIMHRESKITLRKNIIYVSPETPTTCRVLFRDYKPAGTLTYDKMLYQAMNRMIIDRVFEQDVVSIMSQTDNMRGMDRQPYVMPAECDVLIRMFQKWWGAAKAL